MLTVFHNRRWDSDFLTVRKVLPQLGEVDAVRSALGPLPARDQARLARGSAAGRRACSAISGPHMIDQALLLFGMPDAVSADLLAQRAGAEVDDYFDLTLHYGERRVCLRCSTLIAEPRPRFAVHGTGGSFVKYGLDPQEAQLKAGMDPRDEGFGVDPTRRHDRLRRRRARRGAERARQLSRLLRSASATASSATCPRRSNPPTRAPA